MMGHVEVDVLEENEVMRKEGGAGSAHKRERDRQQERQRPSEERMLEV